MGMDLIRVHVDKTIADLSDVEYEALLDDVSGQVKEKLTEGRDKAVVYIEQEAPQRVMRSIYACQYDRVNNKVYFYQGKGDAV